jgi:hypothetical protein
VTGHSIADGAYTIALDSTQVTAVSGGSTMTTSRPTDTFYRLYGDFNADGRVNVTDTGKLTTTFGLTTGTPGYLDYFDFNADGRVNVTDSGAITSRFGTFWNGFTVTI